MAKWSTDAALLAMCLIAGTAVQAQTLPSHGPGAGMPEPTPFAGIPAGPGPCPAPSAAPTDTPMTLPANIPNAWDDRAGTCPACYFYLGAMNLKRERMGLGSGPVFVLDPGGESGNGVGPSAPAVQSFRDLRPNFNWGIRGTLGYHWDENAVEFSGYYLFQNDSYLLHGIPGRLDSFFTNPPLGFEGNNGLWLQADLGRTGLQTSLGSAEGNYHWWLGPSSTFHWFAGVRYLDVQEKLSIFTDDEGLTTPDPVRKAEYSVRAHNRIIAPQLGFEHSIPMCHWLAFTYNFKGAWGVNIMDQDARLKRGDGFVGREGHRDHTLFSHLYDLGLYFDVCLAANMRVRAGYNALIVADIAEAVRLVDFDLSNPRAMRVNDQGNIYYQGFVLEWQVVF